MAKDEGRFDLLRSSLDGLKRRFQDAAIPRSPNKAWLLHCHEQDGGIPTVFKVADGFDVNRGGLGNAARRDGRRIEFRDGRNIVEPSFTRWVQLAGWSDFVHLGDDAARLLGGLPAAVSARLWNDLPGGTVLLKGLPLWTLAVFELANAKVDGSPLHANRYVPGEAGPIELNSLGAWFREFKLMQSSPQFPNWYSTLPDFAAASVQALDILQSWLADALKQETEANGEPLKPVELQAETLAGGDESTEARFEFRPNGDGYFLNGFGQSGHVTAKGAKGLRDLFRLVQTPGVPVPMLELDAGPGVERAEGDGQSRQPVADGETLKQLADKRKQLRADIASAGSDMERSELQAELGKLEETAKGMKGLNGKPRDLNNPLDKLRPKLLKRISAAGNKLRKANLEKLADHFGLAVFSESSYLVYRPAVEGVTWNVSKL